MRRRKSEKRDWSQVEIDFLLKNYNKMSLSQIGIAVMQPVSAVKRKHEELTGSAANIVADQSSNSFSKAGKKILGTTTRIGKRADLDMFFRSSWEANTARLLNFLKRAKDNMAVESWEYEPYTFWFEGIKKGNRFYTPDFYVKFKNGEYAWIEVKGWLRPGDKTKLRRFKKYHPDEFKHLWAITGTQRTAAYKFFVEELRIDPAKVLIYKDLTLSFASSIKNWER